MRFKTNPQSALETLKQKPELEQKTSFVRPRFKRNVDVNMVVTNKGEKRNFEVGFGPYGGRWHGCVGIYLFNTNRRGRLWPLGNARQRVDIQLRFRRVK